MLPTIISAGAGWRSIAKQYPRLIWSVDQPICSIIGCMRMRQWGPESPDPLAAMVSCPRFPWTHSSNVAPRGISAAHPNSALCLCPTFLSMAAQRDLTSPKASVPKCRILHSPGCRGWPSSACSSLRLPAALLQLPDPLPCDLGVFATTFDFDVVLVGVNRLIVLLCFRVHVA
jgi:hypothetical protein